MADVDINPFGGAEAPEGPQYSERPPSGGNDRTKYESTDEHIPLTPVGGSTWEPE